MRRALLLAVALAACARSTPPPTPPVLPPAPGLAGLEALPRQALPAGQCGLYLWANTPPRLVIAVTGGTARIARGGRQIDLAQVDADGDPVMGFAPRMSFGPAGSSPGQAASRLSLDLTIEERRGLIGGAAVPSGAARVSEPDGTEITVPVAGLIGCQ